MDIRFGTILLALSSLLPMAASAQAVSPKEIEESWVDKSLRGSTAAGRTFVMKLQRGGVISISGDAANDTGSWRLSESGYCTTWKTIRAGQERCFTARRAANGDITVYNPDGSTSGYISMVQ